MNSGSQPPARRPFTILKGVIATFLIVFGISCQFEGGENVSASEVYQLHCKRCHGSDGKKGKKGAKDLNLSTMDLTTRVSHITEGKGKMPSFDDRLSDEQIRKVAEYTLQTFRPEADSTSH